MYTHIHAEIDITHAHISTSAYAKWNEQFKVAFSNFRFVSIGVMGGHVQIRGRFLFHHACKAHKYLCIYVYIYTCIDVHT